MKPFPKPINGKMEGAWDYYDVDEVDAWREELRRKLQKLVDNPPYYDGESPSERYVTSQVGLAAEILEAL